MSLLFKTSSVASGTCLFCKKLKDHAKTDVCNLKEEDSDEVVLGESDHKDLSKISQTIFPECSQQNEVSFYPLNLNPGSTEVVLES
jgi:hypothetical protein